MVKGRELPVICLEEVGPAQEETREAVRRFGEIVGRSMTSAQMLEGFARLAEAVRRLRVSLVRLQQSAGLPAVHAFTPDLDLRCSVAGCGLGPEEHDLW